MCVRGPRCERVQDGDASVCVCAQMCVCLCVETIGGAFGFTGKNPAGSQDGNQTPQRPTEP